MNAISLLKEQHRKVERLFAQLEKRSGDVEATVTELATDLAAHMVIEQEIFYPAVKKIDEDLVLESFEEHAIARFALGRLVKSTPSAESFNARVTALKELIEHHVKEEEADLFPKVQKAMGASLEDLGMRMKARFEQAVEEGYEDAIVEARHAKASTITNAPNGTKAR